jgi:ferredoxin--NADP+ reductase
VILAHGASGDKRLGIPGEELPGCHGAAEFVGWYNGHPDFRDRQFDLSQRCAVILGNGNVALDVARILAKSPESLAKTDIADHALQALMRSKVTDIHVVGRRGPLQAKFSTNELRELGELEDCAVHCKATDMPEITGTEDGAAAANIAWFRRHIAPLSPNAGKRIHFHFFSSPAFASGGDRLQSVAFSGGTLEESPAGLLFRAIGYRGVPVAGIPFDGNLGIVPTIEHRVTGPEGEAVPRLYATGWIKRGPSGIIGTNRADSVAVVRRVMEDLGAMPARASRGAAGLRNCLHQAGREFVDFTQWLRIDRAEVEAGAARSKPREKFTHVRDFLLVAQGN